MRDVKELTFLVKNFADALFFVTPAPGTDDHFFREVLVQGLNEVLVRIQRGGPWDGVAIDRVFRPVRRVLLVALEWRDRKKDQPLTEWIDRLREAMREAGIVL